MVHLETQLDTQTVPNLENLRRSDFSNSFDGVLSLNNCDVESQPTYHESTVILSECKSLVVTMQGHHKSLELVLQRIRTLTETCEFWVHEQHETLICPTAIPSSLRLNPKLWFHLVKSESPNPQHSF